MSTSISIVSNTTATTTDVKETMMPTSKIHEHNQLRPLHCVAQQYAWGRLGSSSTVARMKDAQCLLHGDDDNDDNDNDDNDNDDDDDAEFEIDESKPYAELWLGTHPNGMSYVSTGIDNCGRKQSLIDYVNENNTMHCGSGDMKDLSFLLKILSVRKVLSIQAHPDKALAEKLHAERPNVYKDPNHKPEMAIALSEKVRAMCGFRPISEIAIHLDQYIELRELFGEDITAQIQELGATDDASSSSPPQDAVRDTLQKMFRGYMETDADTISTLVHKLVLRIKTMPIDTTNDVQKLILQLNEQFPSDCGIFAPLIFNIVELKKGEGLFIEANEPHAYISGEIIECMACSDNVVRAGLTPKLKDVNTLVNMLTYKCCMPNINRGQKIDDYCIRYQPPVRDFVMELIHVPAGHTYEMIDVGNTPSIILTTDGEASLKQQRDEDDNDNNGGEQPSQPPLCGMEVSFGSAAFLSANTNCTIMAGPNGVQFTRAYTNVYYNE